MPLLRNRVKEGRGVATVISVVADVSNYHDLSTL